LYSTPSDYFNSQTSGLDALHVPAERLALLHLVTLFAIGLVRDALLANVVRFAITASLHCSRTGSPAATHTDFAHVPSRPHSSSDLHAVLNGFTDSQTCISLQNTPAFMSQ
jgi:hypothetical protein